jgi:monoamine oxidase
MPTLYTALRAQHRQKLVAPKAQPLPKLAKPAKTEHPLLRTEQQMVVNYAIGVPVTDKRRLPAKRVVVVGAGLAGLCAAYELHGLKSSYDVTVYEARDRVGGRVSSISDFIPGKTVEGGGELIGANHPLWNLYKRHFHLRFTDVEDYGHSPVRFGNRTLRFEEAKRLTDELEAELDSLTRLAETIIDPFEPWANPNAPQLDAISLAAWIKREKCSRRCKKALTDMLEADNGTPSAEQSLLGILAMIKGGGLDRYWTETEVYRCGGGNQRLAEKFREVLNRDRTRVITNARVTAIRRRGKEVAVTVNVAGKTETVLARDVVLAVPPSVWSRIRFVDPELSIHLSRPPEMADNVKFLMSFSDRFWEQFASSPTLSQDGPVNLTWETTEGQREGDFAMVAFSGARDADQCRRWTAAERSKRYVEAMQAAYPGIGHKMKKSRFMNWSKDRWARASYYFPRPTEITKWGPFWKNGYQDWLHFAGEHTCYAFMGYMEGALNSGYRVARKLAVRDGLFSG